MALLRLRLRRWTWRGQRRSAAFPTSAASMRRQRSEFRRVA
jgi:hypothetical protein